MSSMADYGVEFSSSPTHSRTFLLYDQIVTRINQSLIIRHARCEHIYPAEQYTPVFLLYIRAVIPRENMHESKIFNLITGGSYCNADAQRPDSRFYTDDEKSYPLKGGRDTMSMRLSG